MKNILEPWRKFLIEQEAGVSGPEGVSKIATQPQRTLLTKFSLEKVKPTLMSLYANAFKKVERANYAKKGDDDVIAGTFLRNNKINPSTNSMYAHYLDDIKAGYFDSRRRKKVGRPMNDKKFLKWVYHTYIGPGFADSLRAVGNPNIFYYNHESNSIAPVSEASQKNPSLIFVSDGRGGVAMDPTSQGAFKGVFGSGRNVLEEFIKKKNLIANGVAVVGLDKFEDMRQAEFVTTEELDHVFEYLTTVAVKKQTALDKKEKRFTVLNKKREKVGDIIDRPEREYQAIVGGSRGFTPIDDLIGVAGNFIKAFWDKAAIDFGITGFNQQKTKMFKLYNKVVFNDEELPKAARVRKNYGVGRTETVKDMLDYMNMTQEIKIAIQFVMEKMRKKGVKSIDDLCADKNFNLRQQIEQPDRSFKASMLVPAICKKSLKVKDPLSGEGMTSEDFRKKLNTVYQERYVEKTK